MRKLLLYNPFLEIVLRIEQQVYAQFALFADNHFRDIMNFCEIGKMALTGRFFGSWMR